MIVRGGCVGGVLVASGHWDSYFGILYGADVADPGVTVGFRLVLAEDLGALR